MEEVYCQVKLGGLGLSLPVFHDFRQNNERMQRLLLKRDAKKLGIALPEAAQVVTKKSAKPSDRSSADPSAKQNTASNAKPNSSQVAEPAASPETAKVNESQASEPEFALTDCAVKGRDIFCDERHYRYVANQGNDALAPSVLSADNKMNLPIFKGDAANETAVSDYLYEAYVRYIQKMLEIGLAEATMTYSKFYHTFRYNLNNGLDFNQRFDEMYEFLKKDKQSMAVGKGPKSYPARITDCLEVTLALVICEHDDDNAIYLKASDS